MSFNVLRKVEGLEQLTSLKKLFLLHNKISSIANLDHFTCLEMLELGSNRIRVRPEGAGEKGGGAHLLICVSLQVIENLDALSSLQSLFLGTNKITKLQNLDGLHNLTVLSIQVPAPLGPPRGRC